MLPTIRLFKALPIVTKRKKNPSKDLLEKTIRRGFIFAPEVVANYGEDALDILIEEIEKEIGLTGEKMNQSFHKSWNKVKNASLEQLFFEQIIHYFTTYGFEELGIYNENSVYIPNEKLDIPELKEDIILIVIRGYTKEEVKEKLLVMLQSGIALKETTIKDILEIINDVGIEEKEIDTIKNKEVKIALYDYLKLVPENPVEFLRYLIYKVANKTLLIKSKKAIEEIKSSLTKENLALGVTIFTRYEKKYGLKRLAEIFYRFKPIFLAFRANKSLKRSVNKIRKLAIKYHIPMKEDYLNNVTSMIKKGQKINEQELTEKLTRVNIFRKIRLAYALKFRTKKVDSILYRVRNGKGWSTDFTFENKDEARRILNIVLKSIASDMEVNLRGKKVFIPDNIVYTLPATEKQFTGDFPSGSYVSIPSDMIFGIHWENVKKDKSKLGYCDIDDSCWRYNNGRIDLDLSLINGGGKIGWDSLYRSEGLDILFSGDVTDAPLPKGASELFYVKRQTEGRNLLYVNYFNYVENIPVPFKIIVAKERVKNLKQNYTINPNNVIMIAKTEIDQKQKILGLLVTTTRECRFYFVESSVGKSITSSNSKLSENKRKYLFDFYTNTISLNDMVVKAGGELVETKDECDIDLSPENLEKDTIIKLLTKK